MGIMSYIVKILPGHIPGIYQVQCPEKNCRDTDRQKEQVDPAHGIKKNTCKYHGGNGARSPYSTVGIIILVLTIGRSG